VSRLACAGESGYLVLPKMKILKKYLSIFQTCLLDFQNIGKFIINCRCIFTTKHLLKLLSTGSSSSPGLDQAENFEQNRPFFLVFSKASLAISLWVKVSPSPRPGRQLCPPHVRAGRFAPHNVRAGRFEPHHIRAGRFAHH
jgi:hypothetical protein